MSEPKDQFPNLYEAGRAGLPIGEWVERDLETRPKERAILEWLLAESRWSEGEMLEQIRSHEIALGQMAVDRFHLAKERDKALALAGEAVAETMESTRMLKNARDQIAALIARKAES